MSASDRRRPLTSRTNGGSSRSGKNLERAAVVEQPQRRPWEGAGEHVVGDGELGGGAEAVLIRDPSPRRGNGGHRGGQVERGRSRISGVRSQAIVRVGALVGVCPLTCRLRKLSGHTPAQTMFVAAARAHPLPHRCSSLIPQGRQKDDPSVQHSSAGWACPLRFASACSAPARSPRPRTSRPAARPPTPSSTRSVTRPRTCSERSPPHTSRASPTRTTTGCSTIRPSTR